MVEHMLLFLFGVLCGIICIFPYVLYRRKLLNAEQSAISAKKIHLDEQLKFTEKLTLDLRAKETATTADRNALDARIISYHELESENLILKRDLQNIDVNVNKLELDREMQRKQHDQLDNKCKSLAERYMSETIKAVVKSIGPNNFSACKQRLLNVIGWCREIGFVVSNEEEGRLLVVLRKEFETAVKAAFEAEEQSRIKAQIREEQRLQNEVDAELKQLDREKIAIQAALDRALAETRDQHSEEVQILRSKLAEAEEKSKRTLSQAQQTKAGFVYVISNIGSFGTDVFKIGMTRRLDPQDRIDELGNASVPFPFDVHMQINCKDAPSLENALHRELYKSRLNKANPRKEYFKTKLDQILEIVRKNHGEVQYVADPVALEYHQSTTMSEEDAEYIMKVFEKNADTGMNQPEDA